MVPHDFILTGLDNNGVPGALNGEKSSEIDGVRNQIKELTIKHDQHLEDLNAL